MGMAEDNARDTRALRKIRTAHEALRIVLDDADAYVEIHPGYRDELRSSYTHLERAAERIEGRWN